MASKWSKSLLVAAFSIVSVFFFNISRAQDNKPGTREEKKEAFDANEVIFAHVLDAHQFHFLSYTSADGKVHQVIIPLPVILYSPQRGLSLFSSSRFEEGTAAYDGYKIEKDRIAAVGPDGL